MMNNHFDLVVEPQTVTHTWDGRSRTTYRSSTLVNASWEFEDGVKIHIKESAEYGATYGGYGGRVDRFSTRPDKKARLFVDAGNFNLLEDLENRCRRPHTAWKAPALEALARIGLFPTKASWNQRAGCSMCPCSPGFILEGVPEARRFDIWVTLPGAPTVDESKPGRQLVGVS